MDRREIEKLDDYFLAHGSVGPAFGSDRCQVIRSFLAPS